MSAKMSYLLVYLVAFSGFWLSLPWFGFLRSEWWPLLLLNKVTLLFGFSGLLLMLKLWRLSSWPCDNTLTSQYCGLYTFWWVLLYWRKDKYRNKYVEHLLCLAFDTWRQHVRWIVMWSPGQTSGSPLGIPVSSPPKRAH